jgi:hypothetical protein
MERRGFFGMLAGICAGTAVAQEHPTSSTAPLVDIPNASGFAYPDPFVSATWYNKEKELHVEVAEGAKIIWHQDGKSYEMKPTKTIVTMPFTKECGLAHQINLSKPIFMLDEVK